MPLSHVCHLFCLTVCTNARKWVGNVGIGFEITRVTEFAKSTENVMRITQSMYAVK